MSRLKAALDPKSIAIVGASENPTKVGGRPMHYLDKFGFKGKYISKLTPTVTTSHFFSTTLSPPGQYPPLRRARSYCSRRAALAYTHTLTLLLPIHPLPHTPYSTD